MNKTDMAIKQCNSNIEEASVQRQHMLYFKITATFKNRLR